MRLRSSDIIGASESCAQPLILACCVQSPASGVVLQIRINNLGFWEFTHPETLVLRAGSVKSKGKGDQWPGSEEEELTRRRHIRTTVGGKRLYKLSQLQLHNKRNLGQSSDSCKNSFQSKNSISNSGQRWQKKVI